MGFKLEWSINFTKIKGMRDFTLILEETLEADWTLFDISAILHMQIFV